MVAGVMVGTMVDDRRDAFHRLYVREAASVTRFARTALGSEAAAQDVCAESFCRAWDRWHRFTGDEAAARAWIFRIARNQVIDQLRAARRVKTIELDEARLGGQVEREDWLVLRQGLSKLGPADRELLAMRAAGLSHAEIGVIQGRSDKAVKQAWHRALQRLRLEIGDER